MQKVDKHYPATAVRRHEYSLCQSSNHSVILKLTYEEVIGSKPQEMQEYVSVLSSLQPDCAVTINQGVTSEIASTTSTFMHCVPIMSEQSRPSFTLSKAGFPCSTIRSSDLVHNKEHSAKSNLTDGQLAGVDAELIRCEITPIRTANNNVENLYNGSANLVDDQIAPHPSSYHFYIRRYRRKREIVQPSILTQGVKNINQLNNNHAHSSELCMSYSELQSAVKSPEDDPLHEQNHPWQVLPPHSTANSYDNRVRLKGCFSLNYPVHHSVSNDSEL